jgi:tRNA(Ile)-lysidine synthase
MMNLRKPKLRQTKSISQNSQSRKLTDLANRLLREWKKLELPLSNASVVIAVSGGADSTALLLVLEELVKSKRLRIKLIVAHLNHKLRGKSSDADAKWVSSLAKKLGCSASVKTVNVLTRVKKTSDNLEQAARRARYEFLETAAKISEAKVILTAHTLDDQVETVLLNLLRGSGAAGLSGIEPVRAIRAGSEILLARPLLSWARHSDTENYCRQRMIDFRVDAMNVDEKFARVRIRTQLLPLMKSFNPRIVESLARSAEILREDNMALESAAARLLELSMDGRAQRAQSPRALSPDLLRLARPALRRRALRQWIAACRVDLRRLEHAHILAVERFLFNTRSGRVIELPGGGKIQRKDGFFFYSGPRSKLQS